MSRVRNDRTFGPKIVPQDWTLTLQCSQKMADFVPYPYNAFYEKKITL